MTKEVTISQLKPRHKTFVLEMLRQDDQQKAYKAAYPNASDEAARVNGYQLLQNPAIAKELDQAYENAKRAAEKKITRRILTKERTQELLCLIAEGEMEIYTKKPVWDRREQKIVTVNILTYPDHKDRMKAIEINNQMAGYNKPDKLEIEHKGISITYEPVGNLKHQN